MMKKLLPGAVVLGLAATLSAQPAPATAPKEAPAPAVEAKPKMDPAEVKTNSSYAMGYRMGSNFSQQFGRFGITMDDLASDEFLKGFEAAVKNEDPSMPEEKLQAGMQALGDMLQAREKTLAEENLAAGKKFLEENGKREGVTTTASGLQYEVLEKGGDEKYVAPKAEKEGEPAPEKQFMVTYKGTTIDGKEFDASPEGQEVPMTLQVVPGFKEALTTMPVGAKWKLYLPSELAYGENRRSAEIGPNSVLIFELKLVKIEDAPERPQASMPFPIPQGGGQ